MSRKLSPSQFIHVNQSHSFKTSPTVQMLVFKEIIASICQGQNCMVIMHVEGRLVTAPPGKNVSASAHYHSRLGLEKWDVSQLQGVTRLSQLQRPWGCNNLHHADIHLPCWIQSRLMTWLLISNKLNAKWIHHCIYFCN